MNSSETRSRSNSQGTVQISAQHKARLEYLSQPVSKPSWKELARQRTAEEVEQIQIDAKSKARIKRPSDRQDGAPVHPGRSLLGRHSHDQLLARVGLDQGPPVRTPAHKPTTGEPRVAAPLWSSLGPPPKQAASYSKLQKVPSEPAGPLWKHCKARPYWPQNLAGGLDGQGVRWDW
eukprot:TRINITY_DN64368_c0_g1_i1.p1 TRINITY_DN64368_c0_g1~~TRINITY_DN64368_c0_g1_i1.p1  ORF type:complete len:176 (+),score=31.66 TRINITY_DN64368_c0_g1_i1:131-658(+)